MAITDSDTSPIASYADCLLVARSDMASVVDSLVAPLSLINALIVAVTLSKREEVINNFNKLESIWDEYQVYETVIAIKNAYKKLSDKEKQVISMIFYAKEKEANQKNIAKKLGVSQPYVSKTIKKFKEYLKE